MAGSRGGAERGQRVRGRRNKRERNVSCRRTDRQPPAPGGTPGTLKAAAWTGGPMPREGPRPWSVCGGRGSLPCPQLLLHGSSPSHPTAGSEAKLLSQFCMGSSRRGTRTLESCSPQPQLLCGNSERDRRQRQEKRQRKTEFEKWKLPFGPRLQVGIPPIPGAVNHSFAA